jgi:ABC-2 type transport system permease protein
MCGQIIFNFFSEATNIAMESILTNASLIKKVFVPNFIFPLSKVISSFVNLLFSLISLFIVMIFTNAKFSLYLLLIPLPFIYIFIFATGVSLLVTALIVFFRDIKYLYGVFITAWAYFTPIFYPASIIPQKYKFILDFNPLFYIITCFRDIVYNSNASELKIHLISLGVGLLSLLVGSIIFRKAQNKFILYI